MTQPYNYRLDLVDPANRFLSGYSEGIGGREREQAMDLRAAQEQRTAELHPLNVRSAELGIEGQAIGNQTARFGLDQRQQAAARQQSFLNDFGALAALGPDMSFSDVQGLVSRYPEMSDSVLGTWAALDDAARAPMQRALAQGIIALRGGNVGLAEEVVNEYATAAENAGNVQDAAIARAGLEVMRTDPNAALATLSSALAIADPDLAKRAMGGDATEDSVQRSIYYNNGTIVRIMRRSGDRVVTGPDGNLVEGPEAGRVIEEARAAGIRDEFDQAAAGREGTLSAEINLGGEAAATVAAAENAQKAAMDAWESLPGIQANIMKLERVKELVDAGAKTGVIQSRLPALDAATQELRNMQSQLGLDVIGSVTFGALSEGELRLALSTALPDTMEGPALKAWVDRKIAAQEKLLAYLEQQAKFLMVPGRQISDWIKHMEGGAPAADASPGAGTGRALDELLRSLEGGN